MPINDGEKLELRGNCTASIPWDITPELGSELACTLGAGHLRRHRSELHEHRIHEEGRIEVEIVTTVEWTNE